MAKNVSSNVTLKCWLNGRHTNSAHSEQTCCSRSVSPSHSSSDQRCELWHMIYTQERLPSSSWLLVICGGKSTVYFTNIPHQTEYGTQAFDVFGKCRISHHKLSFELCWMSQMHLFYNYSMRLFECIIEWCFPIATHIAYVE